MDKICKHNNETDCIYCLLENFQGGLVTAINNRNRKVANEKKIATRHVIDFLVPVLEHEEQMFEKSDARGASLSTIVKLRGFIQELKSRHEVDPGLMHKSVHLQAVEIKRLQHLINDKNDKIIQTNIENARLKKDNRKLKDCAIMVMRRILWPIDTPPSCIRSGCDEAYKMTDELLKELE